MNLKVTFKDSYIEDPVPLVMKCASIPAAMRTTLQHLLETNQAVVIIKNDGSVIRYEKA